MRPIAVGRRNWTYARGERAVAIYSLIETAKLHGTDPEATCAALSNVSPTMNRGADLPWNMPDSGATAVVIVSNNRDLLVLDPWREIRVLKSEAALTLLGTR